MREYLALVAVIAVLVGACSGSRSRGFVRHYDPQGLFATDIPVGNDVTETPPQPSASGAPGLMGGVVSQPPQPSPSPTSQLGGGLSNITQQQAPADQTTYEVFAVTTDSFESLSEMVLYFLTGEPVTDVQIEQPWQLAGNDGEFAVANATFSSGVPPGVKTIPLVTRTA